MAAAMRHVRTRCKAVSCCHPVRAQTYKRVADSRQDLGIPVDHRDLRRLRRSLNVDLNNSEFSCVRQHPSLVGDELLEI